MNPRMVPGLAVYLLLASACQTTGDSRGRSMEDCANACWLIGGVACGDVGQECVDRCVRIDLPAPSECPTEQQLYWDCYWQATSYSCDPNLGTVPSGCGSELAAARSCLGFDAGAADGGRTDAATGNAPISDAAPGQGLGDSALGGDVTPDQ